MNRVIHTWYVTDELWQQHHMPELVQALAQHWPLWRQAQNFQREGLLWFSVQEHCVNQQHWAIDIVAHGSTLNLDIWSILTE